MIFACSPPLPCLLLAAAATLRHAAFYYGLAVTPRQQISPTMLNNVMRLRHYAEVALPAMMSQREPAAFSRRRYADATPPLLPRAAIAAVTLHMPPLLRDAIVAARYGLLPPPYAFDACRCRPLFYAFAMPDTRHDDAVTPAAYAAGFRRCRSSRFALEYAILITL